MALHLFEDSALTRQISEGDLSNPDDDTYNGTAGESKDKELSLANEQTTLAADLASGATSLELSDARFADGDAIIIDDEQMRIASGGGSTTLGIERGYANTTPAAHDAGAAVYSGYDTSLTSDNYYGRLMRFIVALTTDISILGALKAHSGSASGSSACSKHNPNLNPRNHSSNGLGIVPLSAALKSRRAASPHRNRPTGITVPPLPSHACRTGPAGAPCVPRVRQCRLGLCCGGQKDRHATSVVPWRSPRVTPTCLLQRSSGLAVHLRCLL